MDCATPGDVNDELARVQVQTPTRQIAFNAKGDANMNYNILQVREIWRRWLMTVTVIFSFLDIPVNITPSL